MAPSNPAIPLEGTICKGLLIDLAWPDRSEYDLITNLRNQCDIRKWFIDDRPLDLATNHVWLAQGIQRPRESLLSIRLTKGNMFLGIIGWSNWDFVNGTAQFGRLAVDLQRVKSLKDCLPPDYPGIAVDACQTLRDFAMNTMHLKEIRTSYIASNRLARRINHRIGLRPIGSSTVQRHDGAHIPVIELILTRKEWELGIASARASLPTRQPNGASVLL